MNRRDSIKKLMVAGAGLVVLPGWANAWTPELLAVHPSPFTFSEQEILASVADAIIPPGNSIGALSVGVDKFLEKLFSDCYTSDVQANIKLQLENLESSAEKNYQKSFVTCSIAERQTLLVNLSGPDSSPEKDFFTLVKAETIRGYNTSKEVMTNYLHYKVAPGHYYGCVDTKS